MTRSILFDTETTGLDPLGGDRIIEIACIELINDMPTSRHFHSLLDPERDVPEEVSRIHGLTAAHLYGKPKFEEIADTLIAFLGDGRMIAHNAAFDFGFVDAELVRSGRSPLDRARMVCTLELAKKRYPGMPNSLDALCRRHDIDLSARTHHNALLDCQLLAEVYIALTGGRQRGLGLVPAAPALSFAVTAGAVARTPRPITPDEAALAAHARFLDRIPDPLWRVTGA